MNSNEALEPVSENGAIPFGLRVAGVPSLPACLPPRVLLTLLAFAALGRAGIVNEANACAPVPVTPCMVADNTGPIQISNPAQLLFQIVDLNNNGQYWGSYSGGTGFGGVGGGGGLGIYSDVNGLSLPADPASSIQQNVTAAAALLALGASATSAPNPGGSTVVTNSTSSYLTGAFVDTPVAARVDQYQTTIDAILNGGQVFQETFGLPFSDPAVQAAVAAADAILAGDGASYGSPGLVSSSTSLAGSQLTYATTGESPTGAVETTTMDTFGPNYIAVGDNLADLFLVVAGQLDINVNTELLYATDRNAITTSTYLTTQTYDIDGTTTTSTVPEPGSWSMGGAGLLAFMLAAWGKRTLAGRGAGNRG
jgi:hypothetical protein